MRFFGVRDVDLLATKLDNIFLEHRTIFMNIPCFQRNGSRDVQHKKKGVTYFQERKEGGGERQEHRAFGQNGEDMGRVLLRRCWSQRFSQRIHKILLWCLIRKMGNLRDL